MGTESKLPSMARVIEWQKAIFKLMIGLGVAFSGAAIVGYLFLSPMLASMTGGETMGLLEALKLALSGTLGFTALFTIINFVGHGLLWLLGLFRKAEVLKPHNCLSIITSVGTIGTPLGEANVEIEYNDKCSIQSIRFAKCPPPSFTLVEGQSVDHVELYRLDIQAPVEQIKVLLNTSKIECEDVSGESGEWFESLRLETSHYLMNIGTKDGEVLNSQYPERHRKGWDDSWEWVNGSNMKGRAMVIDVPELKDGEDVTLWFSIAWKEAFNEDDCDTWFAADMALPSHSITPHKE